MFGKHTDDEDIRFIFNYFHTDLFVDSLFYRCTLQVRSGTYCNRFASLFATNMLVFIFTF